MMDNNRAALYNQASMFSSIIAHKVLYYIKYIDISINANQDLKDAADNSRFE